MLRCNKCSQAEPHLSDSWCLGCSALEALNGELRLGWGASGSRALAHDILSTAVRQVRALRRLGIAGAGRTRALTPERGAARPAAAASQPLRSPAPPAEAAPERTKSTEGERAAPVKAEPREEESEYDYTDDEDEEEPLSKDSKAPGLTAAPKCAAEPSEKPELPSREEDTDRGSHRDRRDRDRDRDRSRAAHRTVEDHRDRRHGRSRSRHGERARKRRRHRPGHRGGSRHQKTWKAAEDPYRRFHSKQPDSFWDRPPDAP